MDCILLNCVSVFFVVSCSSPKTFSWISMASSSCSIADLKSFLTIKMSLRSTWDRAVSWCSPSNLIRNSRASLMYISAWSAIPESADSDFTRHQYELPINRRIEAVQGWSPSSTLYTGKVSVFQILIACSWSPDALWASKRRKKDQVNFNGIKTHSDDSSILLKGLFRIKLTSSRKRIMYIIYYHAKYLTFSDWLQFPG